MKRLILAVFFLCLALPAQAQVVRVQISDTGQVDNGKVLLLKLNQSGATDGQVPKWDADSGYYRPQGAADSTLFMALFYSWIRLGDSTHDFRIVGYSNGKVDSSWWDKDGFHTTAANTVVDVDTVRTLFLYLSTNSADSGRALSKQYTLDAIGDSIAAHWTAFTTGGASGRISKWAGYLVDVVQSGDSLADSTDTHFLRVDGDTVRTNVSHIYLGPDVGTGSLFTDTAHFKHAFNGLAHSNDTGAYVTKKFTQATIHDSLDANWATFIAGGSAGVAIHDSMYAGDIARKVNVHDSLYAPGFATKANVHDSVYAPGFATKQQLTDTAWMLRDGIHDTAWTIPGIVYTHYGDSVMNAYDSVKNGFQIWHKIDTTTAVIPQSDSCNGGAARAECADSLNSTHRIMAETFQADTVLAGSLQIGPVGGATWRFGREKALIDAMVLAYNTAADTTYWTTDVSNPGDITSVVAGTGLTGGATSGAATLDIVTGWGLSEHADSIRADSTELDDVFLKRWETADSTIKVPDSIACLDIKVDTRAVIQAVDADTVDGGYYIGALDMGGATSIEIANVDNPTTDAEGEIAWDANDDAIEVFSGDENESALIPMYQKLDATIFAPDGINGTIAIFHVDALLYPFGIEIDQVSVTIPSDGAYTMVFEEWAGDPPAAQADIETVTTGAGDSYMEDGTITNDVLDADDYIFLHVPATDVNWVHVQIIYHVVAGN